MARLFKHRLALGRATVDRLLRPWVYCRICGDPLAPAHYGRNCEDCSKWSGALIRAHEARKLRAWFGDLS